MSIKTLKILASISAILLLTSCSKMNSWFGSSAKTEETKPITYVEPVEAEYIGSPDAQPTQFVEKELDKHVLLHKKYGKNHNVKKSHFTSEPVIGELCKCTEVKYSSVADKEQTLGTISANSALPEPKRQYIQQEEPKKVIKKKVAKKHTPKPKHVDVYNAPVASETHTETHTPVILSEPAPVAPSVTPHVAPTPIPAAPVAVERPTPAVVAPEAPQATPAVSAPVVPTPAPVSPAVETPSAPQSGNVVFARVTDLSFNESELQLSPAHSASLDKIIEDLKANPGKNVKIQSYAYSSSSNASEARRNSYQRAIAVRKYLIDKDILATRISVNAFEDINNKANKIELTIEDTKTQ